MKPKSQENLQEELSSCDNHIKWLNVVVRLAKSYGFQYATLMHMPKPSDRFFSTISAASNLPSKLVQRFDEAELLHHGPNYATLIYSVLPQAWQSSEFDHSDPRQAEIKAILEDFDISSGIMFSFNSFTGERYVMRFDGTERILSKRELNDLSMDALIAFDHYQNLRRISNSVAKILTKREIDVVKWTAQGKTSSEIAAILSLSDHTVNAYMNNAIRKLECVNRTQLVAKAIRLKLIA